VRQPAYDLGKIAGEAMLRLIQSQPIPVTDLPLQVIVRESTLRRRG
jgi:LacI family transcriptional regulator